VWLDKPPEDDDLESPENHLNQHFMRLGMELILSFGVLTEPAPGYDAPHIRDGSDVSEGESEDEDDSQSDAGSISGRSDISAAHISEAGLMADKEFRSEVKQSLERAFAENHSVDNAAVELKTLRMASNVPLTRVKEAVISAIVEKIPIIEEGGPLQRKEVSSTIARWGQLINRIGGVDPVETITLLQVSNVDSC